MLFLKRFIFVSLCFVLTHEPAYAAAALDGATLSLVWAIPFVGMLLSIALFPLWVPGVWHQHYGKISAFWASCLLLPMLYFFGGAATLPALSHAVFLEYIPFITVLFALFTVAGGVYISGNLHGTPVLNTSLLALGAALASVIGTTGASMVLIRPLIRANDHRTKNVHVVIFFIFLVSNIGGALTPLGDPPLFLGFLNGVSFFWTTHHLFAEMIFCSIILLGVFFIFDHVLLRGEERSGTLLKKDPTPDNKRGLRLHGKRNIALLIAMIAIILLSTVFDFGVVSLLGTEVKIQFLLRDLFLLLAAALSLAITPSFIRKGNGFTFGPITEVAKLFVAIFITIIPVLAILAAGKAGSLAPLVSSVTYADGSANNMMYFWMTGALSAFLDNAPTYLVFFNIAGGDATSLMTTGALTLAAISCGAVFMGAMTYIGNAPNFMVKAIAEDMNIKMPSFFGFMLWSCLFLLPVFVAMSLVFFS